MKIIDKLKNMFTEEVEEEVVPIKKEVLHVEIPSPAMKRERVNLEEKLDKEDLEEEVVKAPSKTPAPIFFDDTDFDTLEKPKPKVEEKPREYGTRPIPKIEGYKGPAPKKEEKKIFQPTPIISPIYGVLDKNYRKEDITSRETSQANYHYESKDVSIDDVRKKAYGTLEDDLENTLFGRNSILFHDDIEEPKEEIDIFDELDIVEGNSTSDFDKKEDLLDLFVEKEIPVKRYREKREIEIEVGEQPHKEASTYDELEMTITDSDDLLFQLNRSTTMEEADQIAKHAAETQQEVTVNDSELFNLIDSMYEKKEEDEL